MSWIAIVSLAIIAVLVGCLLAVTTVRFAERKEGEPFLRIRIVLPGETKVYEWPRK